MRPIVLGIIGLSIAAFGIYVGWFGFKALVHSKITEALALKKGSETRKNWSKFPIALDFNVTIFNVTNPDEVHVGKKAKVQAVGPFIYNQWKSKVNFVDEPMPEDKVTYNGVNLYYFDENASKPLTENEVVVIPHMLILSFATLTLQTKPGSLNLINKAIPYLFNNPKSIFVTTTVKEFLFDGILINCTKVKEFAANAVCDVIRNNPKGLEVVDNDYFKFSILGLTNNTPSADSITVKRGMVDISEVGKVVLWNGKSELDVWSGPQCNEIKGTDGTIFPPFMEPTREVGFFAGDFCRSFPLRYQTPKDYKRIKGLHYVSDFGDMSTDPDLKCFCPTNNTCLKKGAFDTTKCTGAPIILTLPHCAECHIDYLNGVDGMNPSSEDHRIDFIFEPITGTGVAVAVQVQFNMFVQQIKKITVMKELAQEPFLMPIFYISNGVYLNDSLAKQIRYALYRPASIVKYARFVIIGIGLGLVGLAALRFYKNTKLNPDGSRPDDNKTTITQVGPAY